ncbi:MAG: sulfurtransferase TusA family protein [Halioglobus sp.]
MMLHNMINDMSAGAVVQVVATDPSTERDVPKFCTFLGHSLLSHEVREDTFIYVVQKSLEN